MYQNARYDPQYAHYAAQNQNQNQDLNSKIMENQQRAVQLHQQIKKQQNSQKKEAQPKRKPALSGYS